MTQPFTSASVGIRKHLLIVMGVISNILVQHRWHIPRRQMKRCISVVVERPPTSPGVTAATRALDAGVVNKSGYSGRPCAFCGGIVDCAGVSAYQSLLAGFSDYRWLVNNAHVDDGIVFTATELDTENHS